ncbi:hypothetical protein HY311_02770 [Candidatus Nomurabacteria bacterium]|nr:hypothetical protein [Candidatus Nomurabacteria bacterium]
MINEVAVTDEVAVIRDFIKKLRKEHRIVPGPSAKGLGSDEYGEIGQFVYDELVRSPDESEPWLRLAKNSELLARVLNCVEGEIAFRTARLAKS